MSAKDGRTVRRLTGRVVADQADKTVRVRVQRITKHKLYGKVIRRDADFLAHDEENRYAKGDEVTIEERRRFSKRKAWIVVGKAEKAS